MIDKIATIISMFLWFAFTVSFSITIYNKTLQRIKDWRLKHD